MTNHYGYGRRKEFQVGEFLERQGYQWGITKGSRGPMDVLAWSNSQRLAIQVKATRSDRISDSCLSTTAEASLIELSIAREAIPILSLVSRNYVWFFRLPDRGSWGEGTLRPLRFDYRSLK